MSELQTLAEELLAVPAGEDHDKRTKGVIARIFRLGQDSGWTKHQQLADQTPPPAPKRYAHEAFRPGDDERLSILAETLHTGWRKGTDARYAMTIHRLISDMDADEWEAYVAWVDYCLREMGYTPELPAAKEEVPS